MHRAKDALTAQAPCGRQSLPLEASAVAWQRGWIVRLPVRAEHTVVDKQLVVYERVIVRSREINDVERIEANVRREELSMDVEGEARVGPTLPPGQPR